MQAHLSGPRHGLPSGCQALVGRHGRRALASAVLTSAVLSNAAALAVALGFTVSFSSPVLAQAPPAAAAPAAPAAAAPGQPAPNNLIAAAEPDEDGYLRMPLFKPQQGQSVSEFEAKRRELANRVKTMLRSDLPLGENLVMVDRYLNNFEFRAFTQTTPESLEALPKTRFDFFRQYVQVCKNSEAHADVVRLVYSFMQQVVNNNFHPAVRYNAMIMIGDLNEQEVVRVGSPLLPEPYAGALPFIIERIDDARTPDPVRVAALVGLIRHLEWEPYRTKGGPIPAAVRANMLNVLVKLAEAKDAPQGRSIAGHQWMRRRALEALGLASVATAQANVVETVEKVLLDSSEPAQLRLAAALALSHINIPANQKIDTYELARVLATLATSSVKTEFDRLTAMNMAEQEHWLLYQQLGGGSMGGFGEGGGGMMPGGPGGGPGGPPGGMMRPMAPAMSLPMGMPGGMMGGVDGMMGPNGLPLTPTDPKAYRLDAVRKRLRYNLYCVQAGLGHPIDKTAAAADKGRKGLHRIAANPAEKKAIEELITSVNKLAGAIEKNNVDFTMLETDAKLDAKNLEGVIAKVIPAAAAPAAPAADPANPAAPGKPAVPGAKPANSDDDLLGGGAAPSAAAKPPAAATPPASRPAAAAAPATK